MKDEVIILPKDLETTINQTLVKGNVTDAIINSLKEKYGELRLKSVDDSESYLELKAARKEVRGIAILAEKICKAGREDAVREQKLWLSKEKELVEVKIGAIQAPLDKGIAEYEENKERKEAEEKKKREEAFMQRQATLLKMGAIYADGSFTLEEISYESDNVKGADDEIWNDIILPKFKKAFDKIEVERTAQEKKRADEIEALRLEREKFEKDREELRKQQEEMQKFQEEKAKAEREKLMEQQKEEGAKAQLKWSTRANQLRGLGLMYSGAHDAFILEDINIDNKTELSLMLDSEWVALIEKIKPVAEKKAIEIELRLKQSQADELAKAVEEGKRIERERIAEEERQAEVLKKQQEEQRQEQLAAQSDKQKWEVFTALLSAVAVPELSSKHFKRKVAMAIEKLEEIKEL